MSIELYPYQIEAVNKLRNGNILCGGVGTGKSRTSLAYVYICELEGDLDVVVVDPITKEVIKRYGKWAPPKVKKDIYIITTAKKRDTKEWSLELTPFGLSDLDRYKKEGVTNNVIIDSWNNISKYKRVTNAIFIFDEQRVTGKGAWVKYFYKITKKNKNKWILLSATPGDNWSDYIPVFVANGFYQNKTEFKQMHIVYKPYMDYPVIDHYENKPLLYSYKREILVLMESPFKIAKTRRHEICSYDKQLYKNILKTRWDPYDDCPIENISKLCYILRKVVNEDQSRVNRLLDLLMKIDKAIIFYNYTYELNIIRRVATQLGFDIGEWNGENHTPVPTSNKWVYICQYNSAAEGWNCITTDTIIFYSLSYSYKMMKQAEGRIDRANTPFKELFYYYFRSYSPIDESIMKALKLKKNFNEKDHMKEITCEFKQCPKLKVKS